VKILSNRLDKFLIENDIICNEQIGFKKGCRTSDHILTLKCLIDKPFKVSKCLLLLLPPESKHQYVDGFP
jgi:hypothetical protein